MTRSSSSLRTLGATLAAAFVLGLVTPVLADASSADMQTARALLKDGKKLRGEKDFKGALEKFKGAFALVATPVTGRELAFAYLDVGQLVDAREIAVSVVQMPKAKDETDASDKARGDCGKLASDLAARIPSLSIRLLAPAGVASQVTVDGVALSTAALGIARKIDPGKHVVIATANGSPEARAEVDLKEGESREVTLTLEAGKTGASTVTAPSTSGTSSAPSSSPSSSTPSSSTGSSSHALTYVGFGVAGVGVVVGSVAGLLAFSKLSSAKDGCVDTRCPPSSQGGLDSSKTWGTLSTVAFIVGGVGATVGIVSLFTGSSSRDAGRSSGGAPSTSSTLTPFFGLGSAGVSGAF